MSPESATAAPAAPLTFCEIAQQHGEVVLALVIAERLSDDPLHASRAAESYLAKLECDGCGAMKDQQMAAVVRKTVNSAALALGE
jgi:hypothetical protein